jgi:tetratricopeptide (TPR) repeat protein
MQTASRALAPLVSMALLAAAAALPACGGADAHRASHIARGQQYFAQGKLEKARIEFSNALQIAPQDAAARYLMGKILERLGDLRGAAGMYQAAIDVDSGQLAARAGLARLYLLAGLPEKALSLIKPGLARQPDNAELLGVRALAHLRLKDPTQALADAERAVRLAPSNTDVVLGLADVYRETEQPERALQLLRTAIERAPDALDLRRSLAGMYAARGEEKLAEAQLLKLVELRPKALDVRLQLAAFYAGGRHFDEAQRTLRAAVTDLPEREEAKLAYAQFLAQNRADARGEQALRALIADQPRDYVLQIALGELQQRAGEMPQAVGTYRAIVARDPRGPEGVAARDRLAALDVLGGHFDDARPLLAQALQDNPHDDDALTMRANLALRDGDPVSAIADLRAVLRDQPQSLSILRSLARAQLANHSPVLAEENLRTALAIAPQDVGVRTDLGELLTRVQRAEEAVTLLEETVQANPSAIAAHTALIEAYLARGDLSAARAAAEHLKSDLPGQPLGWYLAGQIAERQHRLDEAQREFEQAIRLQPSATDALAALARLELGRGQGARALELLHGARQRMPGNAEVQELLGELYVAQRNYPEAIAALAEALRLAPNWWLPYRNLALARLAGQDSAGALAAYEAGVKATGEPLLVVDLAEAYVQQGRVDDALRQYESLHQRRPSLDVATNNLAMLLVTYRHDQASLERARDLTTAFAGSDVAAFLDTYGWVRLKEGDVPAALTALQRASQEATASKVILYHLGMAYLKAGQPDKARTSLEAALAGGDSFSGTQEARLALAQIKGRTG